MDLGGGHELGNDGADAQQVMKRNPADEMLGLLSGYWYSQCLYVMAELGIADLLAAGSRSAAELAANTRSHPESLYRFLRGLSSAGILRELDGRQFALTELSETLRSDHPAALRAVALLGGHPAHWLAWGNLLHSVQTGEAAFGAAHNESFFEVLARDVGLSSTFQSVLGRLAVVDRAVVEAVDLTNCERIADVGGGSGGLAGQIAASYPRSAVILYDRKHVLSAARPIQGVEFVSGDFFESVPAGCDAYFLKFVLHDWDDVRASAILTNCRNAMRADGCIFVVEILVPKDTTASVAKTHDINMLVLTGGRERTADEYRSLFKAAGLQLIRIIPTAAGVSVLEAGRLPTSGRDPEV
jgi:hypothetical protein